MLLKYSTLLIFVLAAAVRCKKTSSTTGSAEYYPISGTLYLTNYYGATADSTPVSNKLVYIGFNNGIGYDTTNHFNSVRTDGNGIYTFFIIDSTRRYRLYSLVSDTSSSTFAPFYYASSLTDSPYKRERKYPLTLQTDTINRNGIFFLTVDAIGQTLPGVTVLLYQSALADSTDLKFTGAGSYRRLVTDSIGRAFTGQLPPGSFYINALLIVSNDTLKTYRSMLNMPVTGVVSDTLRLK